MGTEHFTLSLMGMHANSVISSHRIDQVRVPFTYTCYPTGGSLSR